MNKRAAFILSIAALALSSAAPPASYNVLIRGGTIYDGSGAAPFFCSLRFSKRELSAGVRVKATSMETMIDIAMVSVNL